jgi:PPOX class probable F420-dependent enzyme
MLKSVTINDLGDLLERPILATFGTVRKDGSILLSPVWHEWTDGAFSIVIWAGDIKAKNIGRNPRVSILVAEQTPPYRGIEARGDATVEVGLDLMPSVRRLAQRYIGTEAGLVYAESFSDDELALVRVVPRALRAWDLSKND